MKTNRNPIYVLSIILITFGLVLSSCSPRPTASPSALATNAPASVPLTDTAAPNLLQPATNATTASILFPLLTLKPGDFYFSVDGRTSFIFSRNIAGYHPVDYDTFLDWSKAGGSRVARIQLDSLGMGYTKTGEVDQGWAVQWDQIFDKAQADGIYILPVFSGWFDWNAGSGYSTWKSNPLNQANGGPVQTPAELFQKGSATQAMWMQWMQSLVKRWQGRKNILAWEIFSEVNLASGVTEPSGIDFVNTAAALIRAADPTRPVTASLADTGTWPDFYRSTAIDFINIHPYPPSAQLDRHIISGVRDYLSTYKRPVLIGESGLNAATPDSAEGKISVAENARLGIQHAIWAGVVSGAMNGRALYWEDSFGIYFPSLGIPWMQKYETEELPAVNFVSGVDFSGFQPLASTTSSSVWGAAVGNENMVLGWYRDAGSEPPDWTLQPVVSKQNVTVTVPGKASNWKVDFFDTRDGTTILNSVAVSQTGSTITIPLPDFQDDIAFKMTAGMGTGTVPTLASAKGTETSTAPTLASTTMTNPIAGTWSGTISSLDGTFSTPVKLFIQAGCQAGKICGTFSAPQLSCTGNLFLQAVDGRNFLFQEQNVSGAASCLSGGFEQLQFMADGTLSYAYLTTPGSAAASTGILKHP
jgi:hypothetical protein